MKKFIFWIFCLFFFIPVTIAQEAENAVDAEFVELDHLGIINTDGTISQTGDNFKKRLHIQSRQGNENQQMRSHVHIDQFGDNNVAEWDQEGSNNSFTLTQDGDGNIHTGYLRGEENLIKVLQHGNNNQLRQELEGNSIGLDVTQKGNEHELIQIEKSGASPAYQIRQEGNHGMKVKIEHERY